MDPQQGPGGSKDRGAGSEWEAAYAKARFPAWLSSLPRAQRSARRSRFDPAPRLAVHTSAGGELKLKELQRQVAPEVLARLAQGAETGAGAAAVGKKEVRAAVAARAAASSRFALDGKVVRLAKA